MKFCHVSGIHFFSMITLNMNGHIVYKLKQYKMSINMPNNQTVVYL